MMAAIHYHAGQFPPANLDWQVLIPLIGPAAGAVARYDGMLSAIPNPGVLRSPLTTREAVLSSRIEGTQATMGEVLEFEAGREMASPERRDDIQFERPVFPSSLFVAEAGIPAKTARRILDALCKGDVLRVIFRGSGRRSNVLAFFELVNVVEGHEVF